VTVVTPTIFVAYVLLIALSLFLDPKRKKVHPKGKYSILNMLLFSTFKMLFAIGFVIVIALTRRVSLSRVLGFSGFSLSWQSIGFGIIAAFGFVLIYVLWQVLASRISKKIQADEAASGMIDLLPKQWLPLVLLFLTISLEAGLLEEIFFRGIMQTNFSNFIAPLWAIVISGILFGFAHFYQGRSGVAGTSVLGIWLGVTYAATGNLLVPIVGHFFGDFACMMLGAKTIMRRKNDSKNN
jgi:membrane protease YdiL (CAAX protease family)